MDINEVLKNLNVELPVPPANGGIYKPVKQVGKLLFVSGQGCTRDGKPLYQGKVGKECSLEDGQMAAKVCALNALSVLNEYLGDLNKIKCLVKTLVFVSSDSSFSKQHLVANGCSKFLSEIFGDDAGVGSRSAVGVAQLPGNIPVEIEFVFEEK